MATSTPGEDVYAETLAVFDGGEAAHEPLTTPEVAEALDLERRTAYKRLDRLAERGALETKKAGARARVWWRPPDAETEARDLERYETVVETVDDGIYVVDEEGRFTMVNDRYVDMVDASRDELLGSHVSAVVEDAVADQAQELEGKLRDGDAETATLEATLPAEDGPIVAEATFSILPTDAGHERVAVVRDVTDRVERERELEATKAELEAEQEFVDTALDQLEDVFFVLDTDGQLVRWNEQLPALSGYTDDELAGTSVFELLPESDHERIAEAMERLYGGTPPATPETELVGSDGERVPVAINGSVLTDDGTVLGIVGTARDITARKRRERELERNEVLFEESADVNSVIGPDGVLKHVTPSVEPVLGYERDELVGEDAFEYVHPDDREEMRATFERVVAGPDDRATAQFRFARADGSWAVFEATARDLVDDPVVEGVVTYTRDVTDRVERERALEATKAELETEREFVETALDTFDDAFYVFDADGELVRWNARANAMTGYTDQELDGMHVLEFVAEPDHERVGGAVEDILDGSVETLETELVATDGERTPVLVNGAPMTDDGEVVAIVGSARDISDRIERERELERYEVLFEESTDVNAVMSPDGVFEHLTPSVEWVLGYERDELVGEDAFAYVHPEDRDRLAERFEELVGESTRGDPVEFRFRRADGSWAVLEAGARDLVDDPDIEGIVVYTREVTERVERERELERRVRQQEAVADLGRLALETDDLDELFDAAVERVAVALDHDYCKVLEHRPASGDLLLRNGVGWDEGVVGEVAVGTDRDSQAGFTMESEDPVVVTDLATEARFSGPDLLVDHDVTSGVSMVIGPADDPWGVLGTHHTERRAYDPQDVAFVHAVANVLATAIERRRHRRELERYEAVLETVWDGIVVLDPDDRFLMVNDALCEMTGYDRDELVGADAMTILDETAYDAAAELHDEVLAGDRDVATLEYDLQAADGDPVSVEARFGPYELDDGTVGGAGVIRDVTERLERERLLERQRERLRALNNLNAVVREITQAVVDESTRGEIERVVCERLASSDSYQFAWICGVDPGTGAVEPRHEAGVEGYLEEIPLSTDPDEPEGRGPFGRAVRSHETAVTGDALDDPGFEPWREYARAYGYRSSAAIPIVHEGVLYGVLGVYSERPGAFDDEERAVIAQLGSLVGHSLAAVDRKRALTSDDVVELRFQFRDIFDDGVLEPATTGQVSIERTVDLGDGSHLAYGTATGDAIETVRSGVASDETPHWTGLDVIEEDEDGTRFQLRLAEPPIFSLVASYGGYVAGAEIADGDLGMTIHLSPTVDVRRFVEAVRSEYPELEPASRRQVTRTDDSVHPVRAVLGEELTDRQRAVLEVAYYAGFFEWPRQSSGEDVADSVGITPSTFHQHLRKAERKVFDRLFEAV